MLTIQNDHRTEDVLDLRETHCDTHSHGSWPAEHHAAPLRYLNIPEFSPTEEIAAASAALLHLAPLFRNDENFFQQFSTALVPCRDYGDVSAATSSRK